MQKTFYAPAKINLCLHVLGRLANGYHELAMAMQRVDLFDTITISLSKQRGIRVQCSGVELTCDGENIAARAAQLLLAEMKCDIGVEIEIEKKIPVAAGLGGGSSDAATVLLGLSEMLNAGISRSRLQKLGGQLGSDVPFFVFGQPAWATGTGICLEPLPVLPDVTYLLVNPGIAVSTAEVYRSLQLTKGGELANLPRFSVVTKEDLCCALHNDLERVTLNRFPLIAEIKQRLVELGALDALMSGSGSTVFGIYSDYSAAENAAQYLSTEKEWFVQPVRPI